MPKIKLLAELTPLWLRRGEYPVRQLLRTVTWGEFRGDAFLPFRAIEILRRQAGVRPRGQPIDLGSSNSFQIAAAGQWTVLPDREQFESTASKQETQLASKVEEIPKE